MKKHEVFQLLVNPFTRIAGWQALILGWVIISLTTYLGWKNGLIFDGLVGIHFAQVTLMQTFIFQLTDWLCLSLVFWVGGLIFSKSSLRIIDVLGTTALSEFPFLIISLIGFSPIAQHSKSAANEMMLIMSRNVSGIGSLLLLIVIGIAVTIWFIALLYNAFNVSCNVPKPRNIFVFIGGFILSLIVASVFSFIFMTSNPEKMLSALPAEESTVVQGDFNIIDEISLQIANKIQQEKYDEVVTYFDDVLKEHLSAQKLKEVTAQFGALKQVGTDVKNMEHDNKRLVFIPCEFEKARLNLQLTFDSENRVCGIFFKPALF